jgi:hypothetical protein
MSENAGEGIPIHQVETEEPDPDILIYPTVLNGLAGDIFSLYAVEKGDFHLTPAVELQLPGASDQPVSLALGREKASKGIEVGLYVIDQEADTLLPYISFDHDNKRVVTNKGDTIESPASCREIRETLLGIKERLHEVVLRPAHVFDRDTFMEESINDEVARLEARAAELRALQSESGVEETPPTKIAVRIVSGWEDEESVEVEYSEDEVSSLAAAIFSGARTFKELNGRSDVQASEVQVTLKRGSASYNIPPEIWRPYYRTQATSEYGEEWAINYRRRDLAKEAESATTN